MRGEAQDSLHTVLWKWFKISFIAGIALSAGEYQGTVIEVVTGLQGAITSAFGANSLGGVIDNALAPYEALGNALWSESTTGTIPNFALLAAAGMVSCAHFFILLVALGMYLMAKIHLPWCSPSGRSSSCVPCFPQRSALRNNGSRRLYSSRW